MLTRIAVAGVMAALGIGLTGCASDRYGYGGYGGYGYGGGDYYDAGYYDGGYFGWYDGFYYPGTGFYVYDQYRRPYRWNGAQQRYWEGRRGGGNPQARANWQAFARDNRADRRDYRSTVRTDRQALSAGTITPDQFQQQRQAARQDYRQEFRQNYQALRQQNQAAGVGTPPPRAFGGGPRGGGGFRGGRSGGGRHGR